MVPAWLSAVAPCVKDGVTTLSSPAEAKEGLMSGESKCLQGRPKDSSSLVGTSSVHLSQDLGHHLKHRMNIVTVPALLCFRAILVHLVESGPMSAVGERGNHTLRLSTAVTHQIAFLRLPLCQLCGIPKSQLLSLFPERFTLRLLARPLWWLGRLWWNHRLHHSMVFE